MIFPLKQLFSELQGVSVQAGWEHSQVTSVVLSCWVGCGLVWVPACLIPCLSHSASRFVTPDQTYVVDNTPHTPTPFKNALEKYGPIRPLVITGQGVGLMNANETWRGWRLGQGCEQTFICARTKGSVVVPGREGRGEGDIVTGILSL